MWQLDYQCVTDWSKANSEGCHTNVVSEEWLEVTDNEPSGVGGELPGTAIGDVRDEHRIVADDPILEVKARRVPGEGEGGGGSTGSSQVGRSSSRI